MPIARIDAAQVTIDTRQPEAGSVLHGDAMLLEQLLTNLLRNALEALAANPPGQRCITIELGVHDEQCRLTVSDNGPGLSAEQLARAFHVGHGRLGFSGACTSMKRSLRRSISACASE